MLKLSGEFGEAFPSLDEAAKPVIAGAAWGKQDNVSRRRVRDCLLECCVEVRGNSAGVERCFRANQLFEYGCGLTHQDGSLRIRADAACHRCQIDQLVVSARQDDDRFSKRFQRRNR